jgi:flavin-dependent dehydrogenase
MDSTHGTSHHDVVVVGARCAGASTAMLLARQGLDVVVVDRATFPSDTLSTHALARGGVVQLARWGLLEAVVASGAPEIRRASFHLPDGTTVERTIKHRAGVDHLLAPRRHVLDALLVDAAAEAGARIETGTTVTGTGTDDRGRVTGITVRDTEGATRELRARFVVGADGLRSRIARAVDAPLLDERPAAGSAHYTYVAGLDAEGFEFHIGDRSFAGVFPTHGGEANVWVCSPAADPRLSVGGDRTDAFLTLLERAAPRLAVRVRDAQMTAPVRGAVALPNHVRQAAGPGWALVGDAGYHRDPITGHGMTDAFRDAELLAHHLGRVLRGEAPEHDALAAYGHERDQALAPIFELTVQLVQFPPAEEFSALQMELSRRIDEEASWLADRPVVAAAPAAAA